LKTLLNYITYIPQFRRGGLRNFRYF